jgi:subtilisin family serine protease
MIAGSVVVACASDLAHADDAAPRSSPLPLPAIATLNLRGGDVPLLPLADLRPVALAEGSFGPGVYIAALDGPVTPARRLALQNAGAHELAYLPTFALALDLSNANPAALAALPFITRLVAFDPQWSVHPELLRGPDAHPWRTPERQALAAQGRILARLWFWDNADLALARADLALLGVVERSSATVGGSPVIAVDLPAASAAALVAVSGLQFAEPVGEFSTRSLETLRAVVQSNIPGVSPFHAVGLTGVGHLLAVVDDPVNIAHCAFIDPVNAIGPLHRKVHAYTGPLGNNPHGTHVASIAVGDGPGLNPGNTQNSRGVAYGSRLVFAPIPAQSEASVFSVFSANAATGARIHSNSWGADFLFDYDGTCRAVDLLQWQNDDNLIVFSVSNFSIIGNPENAKNILAVGATQNAPNQDAFCSGGSGPTADGRRKPEILAPGCAIVAADRFSGCNTATLSGTSMATPAIAGLAMLTRQYFASGFYPTGQANPADAFLPSGPLLKAVVINAGRDISAFEGFPSLREGWGRAVLDDALYLAGDARSLIIRDVRNASPQALSTGDEVAFFVYVRPGEPLKLTLTWHDAPAEVLAAFAPVNNLDLELIAPDGSTYLGNVFANGVSATGGSADDRNNVEQVLIAAPSEGRALVRLRAPAINVGTQGFALAISGSVAEVPCLADLDGNGEVEPVDVRVFFDAYRGTLPAADLNLDGEIDPLDVSTFFAAFRSGC